MSSNEKNSGTKAAESGLAVNPSGLPQIPGNWRWRAIIDRGDAFHRLRVELVTGDGTRIAKAALNDFNADYDAAILENTIRRLADNIIHEYRHNIEVSRKLGIEVTFS